MHVIAQMHPADFEAWFSEKVDDVMLTDPRYAATQPAWRALFTSNVQSLIMTSDLSISMAPPAHSLNSVPKKFEHPENTVESIVTEDVISV